MKRCAVALMLIVLLGCSQEDSRDSNNQCKVEQGSHPVMVEMDLSGNMHIKGYYVAPGDLTELVQQWHITSAEIVGTSGAKFGDALKAQSELKQAGVQDVTIAPQSDD